MLPFLTTWCTSSLGIHYALIAQCVDKICKFFSWGFVSNNLRAFLSVVVLNSSVETGFIWLRLTVIWKLSAFCSTLTSTVTQPIRFSHRVLAYYVSFSFARTASFRQTMLRHIVIPEIAPRSTRPTATPRNRRGSSWWGHNLRLKLRQNGRR